MSGPSITLTLRIGQYGERVESVELPISQMLAEELLEPVELSDEPLSLLLASPGLYGGYGDAVTVRKKKFALRKYTSRVIARLIEEKLFEMFGVDDRTNGYSKQQLGSGRP
jgi:hypothetical protein